MNTPVSLKDQALASLFAPVDKAFANFRGLTLIGHRRSVQAGYMSWAMLGGGYADSAVLKQLDPNFHVLAQPTEQYLLDQQGVLRAIEGMK